MKTYCWSCYLPGARFAADKIYLKENRFMVTFSDADMGELFEFFNAFQLMRNIEYPMGGNSMKLREVKAKKIPEIKESELIIKMQSSLRQENMIRKIIRISIIPARILSFRIH